MTLEKQIDELKGSAEHKHGLLGGPDLVHLETKPAPASPHPLQGEMPDHSLATFLYRYSCCYAELLLRLAYHRFPDHCQDARFSLAPPRSPFPAVNKFSRSSISLSVIT